MDNLKAAAQDMARALEAGDIDAYVDWLNRARVNHYALHPSCDSETLRKFSAIVAMDPWRQGLRGGWGRLHLGAYEIGLPQGMHSYRGNPGRHGLDFPVGRRGPDDVGRTSLVAGTNRGHPAAHSGRPSFARLSCNRTEGLIKD